MSRLRLVLPAALCLLAAATGCGSARLLSYNADTGTGVVAIPANYNFWPLKYRDHADRVMAEKCPAGYEVVEEQEVVVGQRATTSASTETQQAIRPRGGPLERTNSTSVMTVSDQTEYRITFRARAVPKPAPAMVATPPVTPVSGPPAGPPPQPIPIHP